MQNNLFYIQIHQLQRDLQKSCCLPGILILTKEDSKIKFLHALSLELMTYIFSLSTSKSSQARSMLNYKTSQEMKIPPSILGEILV